MAETKPIDAMSFEEGLRELETIVRKLESGDAPLEDAINDYTRGNALRQHCEKKLQDARLKVEKIMKKEDGSVTTEPFEAA